MIETGGDNKRPELRVASERFSNVAINPEIRTEYFTLPQKHLKGRVLEYWRGKGLGGSSIANFQAYIRGSAADYDQWARMVSDGFFAWESAVERYKELEKLHFEDDGDKDQFVKLKEGVHGFDGPVDISLQPKKDWAVGMDKLITAANDFGLPICRDQNSGDPIGVGCVSTTSYKGYRITSGSAYLNDPLPNLDIWCHSTATKILWDRQNKDRPKAIGVQLADGRMVRARKELILAAGVIDSPKLLLLSGIGPKTELRHLGIDCLVDHPDLGKKMIDHIWTHLQWSVDSELSDEAAFQDDKMQAKLSREEWLRSQSGLDATRNIPNLIGFLKFNPTRATLDELEKLPDEIKDWIKKPNVPQIEIFLKGLYPQDWRQNGKGEFLAFTVMLMNPQSRGEVTLASKDPAAPPVIDPGYLSHPYDRQTYIDGVREALAFARSPFLRKHVQGEVLVPKSDNEEDILDFCKDNTGSVLHGCGTVRMGSKNDTTACVDTDFRLRGVDKMRVIDLSVTPIITK